MVNVECKAQICCRVETLCVIPTPVAHGARRLPLSSGAHELGTKIHRKFAKYVLSVSHPLGGAGNVGIQPMLAATICSKGCGSATIAGDIRGAIPDMHTIRHPPQRAGVASSEFNSCKPVHQSHRRGCGWLISRQRLSKNTVLCSASDTQAGPRVKHRELTWSLR